MTVSYVERNSADTRTVVIDDKTEEPAKVLLNTSNVFSHAPGFGALFTGRVMAILQDLALTRRLPASRNALNRLALSGARR